MTGATGTPGRRFSFLVNPVSGGGAAPRAVVPVARLLREAGATVEVSYTASAAEVPALVARAVADDAVVVSVGGDGMLSSIAGEVAAAGGVLGVVPAGRGNDFARMLDLPHDPEPQARLLLEAEPRPTDLLAVTTGGAERLVAGSVYCGVDARAAEIVDRSRWLPGPVQYPAAAVRAIASYRPVDCVLTVDGESSRHRAATVVVANSRYYGSGMRIAPDADVADGLVDVVVVEAASRRSLIRSFPKIYDGSHVRLPEVTVRRGTRVTLEGGLGGGGAAPVGADGEALGPLSPSGPALEVAVRPAAVRILA